MSCDSNCGSCGENPNSCGQKPSGCNSDGSKMRPEDFREAPHEMSRIRKVIGVVSGKGGVGKSMVTSMLSVLMRRKEYDVAILDADITGPSIPKAFGLKEKAMGTELGLYPVVTKSGIRVISVNLLLDNDTDPVVWRGPILAGTVTQFWKNVIWDTVDVMFVDMPPGTGDVPLTVFQSLPLDGIIVVTSPQELVSMIVGKAVKMAQMMRIPVLGLVENMSYFQCPNCQEKHEIFGASQVESVAAQYSIPHVARIPMDHELSLGCDKGLIELFNGDWLNELADMIEDSFTDEALDGHDAPAAEQPKEEAKAAPCEAPKQTAARTVVAIPFANGEINQHFGHSERFKLYTIENGEVVETQLKKLDSKVQGHSGIGPWLAKLGTSVAICGGIGAGAQEMLAALNITVLAGVSGDPDEAIAQFLAGTLKASSQATCNHHDEHCHEDGHSCGEHSCHH